MPMPKPITVYIPKLSVKALLDMDHFIKVSSLKIVFHAIALTALAAVS